MKSRNGFVTNSSSSSFVVTFNSIPKTWEDVLAVLFPNGEESVVCYGDPVSTEDIAKTVFKDIQGQKVNDKKAILEAAGGGWPDTPETEKIEQEYNEKEYKLIQNSKGEDTWKARSELWEEKWAKIEEVQNNETKKFIKKNKGKYIYTFGYGDEDGHYFSTLEHGDIFKNLPHIRISRH